MLAEFLKTHGPAASPFSFDQDPWEPPKAPTAASPRNAEPPRRQRKTIRLAARDIKAIVARVLDGLRAALPDAEVERIGWRPEDLLTQRQVAKHCQKSTATIRNWHAQGLRPVGRGRNKLYLFSDVVAFLKTSTSAVPSSVAAKLLGDL